MAIMYELLNGSREVIQRLAAAGVVDPHWLRDLDMYEMFESLPTTCVMCKYTILAEKFGLGEDMVRKRIKEMRG